MAGEQEGEVLGGSKLARKYCKGEGKQFHNERCKHFDPLTWECVLLRHHPLKALYKKERCLPEWKFQRKAHKILKKYPKRLRREDVDVEKCVFGYSNEKGYHKGILDRGVDVPTISRMYGLINLSLNQEIGRTLRRKQLVPPRKKCGTCVHRGPRKSPVCQLKSFPSKKDGNPFPNEHFGTERKADDAPCDGYETRLPRLGNYDDDDVPPIEGGILRSYSALWLRARTWKEQLEQIHAALDVPVVFKAIRRCANNAATQEYREIFQRWYEDNGDIYDYLRKHKESYEKAKSHILNERIGEDKKKRNAYSKKMTRDAEDLGKCLSGKERCRGLSAPGGEGI